MAYPLLALRAQKKNRIMRSPIVLPDLGGAPVILSIWLARPGDRVYAGDRVVEVCLQGITFDVPAPVDGLMMEKLAWPDEVLTPGQILGQVETDP